MSSLRNKIFYIFILFSCNFKNEELIKDLLIINNEVIITHDYIIPEKAVIFPGARFITKGNGKIIVEKPLNIVGNYHIFDHKANIEFRRGSLTELLPEWFGANPCDNADDTKAILKCLEIAKNYESNINIKFSSGMYFINETLVISNSNNINKSINLLGVGLSQSSNTGSSLKWNGASNKSMLIIKNINLSYIEGIDFAGNECLHNIELRPLLYKLIIRYCSFKGVSGNLSANININRGDNLQVSEISIENCTFHSTHGKNVGEFTSASAICGGLANSKNFYINNCAFIGYTKAAIDIDVSDIINIENNTFAFNEIDITCMLCNSFINSNYSERSKAFFNATSSSNVSFTTIISNFFDGDPKDGFVIRDGAGSLVLMNNNFGGASPSEDKNNIRWEHKEFNSIFSIGNFYNNVPNGLYPFYNRSNQLNNNNVFSKGDIGGKNSDGRLKIKFN